MSSLTFPKSRRLTSNKVISDLFNRKGVRVAKHPMSVVYMPLPQGSSEHHQFLFSVPKKRIPKANHRNYMKRRMREAVRLNQSLLYPLQEPHAVMIMYLGTELMSYRETESLITGLFHEITKSH